jgi:hypothetical protein
MNGLLLIDTNPTGSGRTLAGYESHRGIKQLVEAVLTMK